MQGVYPYDAFQQKASAALYQNLYIKVPQDYSTTKRSTYKYKNKLQG